MAFDFQTFGQSTSSSQPKKTLDEIVPPSKEKAVSNPAPNNTIKDVVNIAAEMSGTKPFAKGISTILTMDEVQKIQNKILEDQTHLLDYLSESLEKAKTEGDTKKVKQISEILQRQLKIMEGPTLMESYTKETVPTAKEIAGGAITMGTWLLSPSMPTVTGWTQKAILSRAALSTPIGISAGLGDALMKNKNAPDTVKEMAIGGITSAVLSFGIDEVIKGIRWAVKKLPAMVSYTTEVPQETFEYIANNPEGVNKARKSLQGLTPQQQAEKITSMTQEAIKNMRQNLTREWETRFNQTIQENAGVRVGLSNYEKQLLKKVQRIVPLENLPKDINNMSLKEAYNLYSQVEDLLSKNQLYKTAEGVPVRVLVNKLKDKLISSFGGEESTFAVLLNDYSTKKQILDNVNSLAKAWPAKPQDFATAFSNLTKVFNNDKFSYFHAVDKLGEMTGKNILDYIAAWNTSSIVPFRHGGFDFSEMIRIVLSPITSPRLTSGFIRTTSGLRHLGEGTASQIIHATTPIVSTQAINGLDNTTKK